MLERILEQQQPLCATLIEIRRTDLMPTDNEIIVMETFVEIMRPIAEITEVMVGEKRVTLSVVRISLYKLLNKYLVVKPTDSNVSKEIKTAVKADLENRYTNPEVQELLNKACFLDPRFKSLSFLSEEEKDQILLTIEEEAASIKDSTSDKACENHPCHSKDGPVRKKPKNNSKLLSLLEDVIDKPAIVDISPRETANKEIHKYLCIDANPTENPTKWWKSYCTQLPLVATMARKYLCIPATSVPSERAFSATGNIVNAKHSCLLPENTDILTFLSHNLD